MNASLELLTPDLAGWRMSGRGGFRPAGGGVVESHGGSGLLWYAARSFADFVLEVSWRITGAEDNSGVFVRTPVLPEDDYRAAVEHGYEIQIDDRGIDPQAKRAGSPLHLTGAVYRLAPAARLLSRGVGIWNDFRIVVQANTIIVELNGMEASRLADAARRLDGHIGLQCHHDGSAVQFRALRLTPIGARTV